MRGTQNCNWLKVGAIGDTCGKRCMGEFCKLHSYRMRGGSILPKQCRKCGQATQVCTSCGATVVKINMTRTEKKARKFYKLVLAQGQRKKLVSFTSWFWQSW